MILFLYNSQDSSHLILSDLYPMIRPDTTAPQGEYSSVLDNPITSPHLQVSESELLTEGRPGWGTPKPVRPSLSPSTRPPVHPLHTALHFSLLPVPAAVLLPSSLRSQSYSPDSVLEPGRNTELMTTFMFTESDPGSSRAFPSCGCQVSPKRVNGVVLWLMKQETEGKKKKKPPCVFSRGLRK